MAETKRKFTSIVEAEVVEVTASSVMSSSSSSSASAALKQNKKQ